MYEKEFTLTYHNMVFDKIKRARINLFILYELLQLFCLEQTLKNMYKNKVCINEPV